MEAEIQFVRPCCLLSSDVIGLCSGAGSRGHLALDPVQLVGDTSIHSRSIGLDKLLFRTGASKQDFFLGLPLMEYISILQQKGI